MGVACCAAEDSPDAVVQVGVLQKAPSKGMNMKLEGGDGTPRLYYFGLYGRGEATRMLLTLAGVKFGDIRLSQE